MRRLLWIVSIVIFSLLPEIAAAQTNDFTAGQRVLVTSGETIRSAPSRSSNALGTVLPGDELQVLDDSPTEAEGEFWWSVRSVDQEMDGWLPDIALGPKHLAPTPDPGSRGEGPCAGFDTYAAAYITEFGAVAIVYHDAEAILQDAAIAQMTPEMFATSLTTDDMAMFGEYYAALADAMNRIEAPVFARGWHVLQQQSLAVTGQIYTDGANFGLAAAGGMHSQEVLPLIGGLTEFFAAPNRCPPFLTWAYAMTAYRDVIDTPT